jgi:hypothetical protein
MTRNRARWVEKRKSEVGPGVARRSRAELRMHRQDERRIEGVSCHARSGIECLEQLLPIVEASVRGQDGAGFVDQRVSRASRLRSRGQAAAGQSDGAFAPVNIGLISTVRERRIQAREGVFYRPAVQVPESGDRAHQLMRCSAASVQTAWRCLRRTGRAPRARSRRARVTFVKDNLFPPLVHMRAAYSGYATYLLPFALCAQDRARRTNMVSTSYQGRFGAQTPVSVKDLLSHCPRPC